MHIQRIRYENEVKNSILRSNTLFGATNSYNKVWNVQILLGTIFFVWVNLFLRFLGWGNYVILMN